MRSRLSFWVYRGVIALVLLTALKSAQFTYGLFSTVSAELLLEGESKAIWTTALWTNLNAPILLFLIAVSLIYRSGASVWLFGWFFLSAVVPVLFPIIEMGISGGLILLLAAILILALVITSTLVYLTKHDEVRKP